MKKAKKLTPAMSPVNRMRHRTIMAYVKRQDPRAWALIAQMPMAYRAVLAICTYVGECALAIEERDRATRQLFVSKLVELEHDFFLSDAPAEASDALAGLQIERVEEVPQEFGPN